MTFLPDETFALSLDAQDPLRPFRDLFHIPPAASSGRPSIYLVGNSLGLQPRATRPAIEQELDDWARLGVEGHFHGTHPWFPAHEEVREPLARLVGALPREVVAMNSLTTNLHLLMVSFYRPTRERHRIIIEDTAFPSDSYAVQSQLDFHSRRSGFDPRAGLIRLRPREGESALRTDDILDAIDRNASSTALLMLGGVNYLTGQLFDIPTITAFARSRGIVVGWDLAHAAGNIDLNLHDSGCDFAAWCSYKYLNSGPGAVAGAFVHERHLHVAKPDAVRFGEPSHDGSFPRFAGWWGNDPSTRFKMGPEFEPVASADAWQLSNPPILALAPLRVSLEIFDRATMSSLRAKSIRLTSYLEFLLTDRAAAGVGSNIAGLRVLTPKVAAQRGCQLSLSFSSGARSLHAALGKEGVVCDFREPDVIRVAPVPLYNTFHDVWRFTELIRRASR